VEFEHRDIVTDLVATWDEADPQERSLLLGGIFEGGRG